MEQNSIHQTTNQEKIIAMRSYFIFYREAIHQIFYQLALTFISIAILGLSDSFQLFIVLGLQEFLEFYVSLRILLGKFNDKRAISILELVQCTVELAYLAWLYFTLSLKWRFYTISNTFLLVVLLLQFIKVYQGSKLQDTLRTYFIFETFKRVLFTISSVLLCLKLDDLVAWQWSESFWINWVILIILMVMSAVASINSLSKSLQYFFDKNSISLSEILAHIWFTLQMVCLTITGTVTCSGLQQHLDGLGDSLLERQVFIAVTMLTIFGFATIFWRHQVIRFIREQLLDDLPIGPLPSSNTNIITLNNQTSAQLTSRQVPRVVQKISRTYFGVPDPKKQEKLIGPKHGGQEGHHRRAFSSQAAASSVFSELQPADPVSHQAEEELPNKKSNSVLVTIPQVKESECSISISSQSCVCLICFDKGPDAVFMTCGHGGLCYSCAVDIWKQKEACHLCRKSIDSILQVSLAQKIGDCYKVISTTQMVSQ